MTGRGRAILLRRAKHVVVLVAFLLFVAYFGVWRFWVLVERDFGQPWSTIAALVAGLGLVLIAVAGVVVIATRPPVDPPGPPREGG